MFVKPASGLAVRHPETRRLLALDGEELPETAYWLRRLRDGDVVLVEPPATPSEADVKTPSE